MDHGADLFPKIRIEIGQGALHLRQLFQGLGQRNCVSWAGSSGGEPGNDPFDIRDLAKLFPYPPPLHDFTDQLLNKIQAFIDLFDAA